MPGAGRLGDHASAAADSHGCPSSPHPVMGPATAGSPDVMVNGKPILRVGDGGTYAPSCGMKTWVSIRGAPGVLVDGDPAFRQTDPAQFCSATGALDEGSPDVLIGDGGGGGAAAPGTRADEETDIAFVARFADTHEPVANVRYEITHASGEVSSGRTDGGGKSQTVKKGRGSPRVRFTDQD